MPPYFGCPPFGEPSRAKIPLKLGPAAAKPSRSDTASTFPGSSLDPIDAWRVMLFRKGPAAAAGNFFQSANPSRQPCDLSHPAASLNVSVVRVA